ncbi:MAG: response regulator transcription factor [Bacteroidota bacterium]
MIARKKILIVDDDNMIIALLTFILERENFELSIAKDGNEGAEAVKTQNPDLIIMDVMLPYKSGFEVISLAKKTHTDIPILVLTTLGRVDLTLRDAEALGVAHVLSKPFNAHELLSWIHLLLKKPEEFKIARKSGKTAITQKHPSTYTATDQ